MSTFCLGCGNSMEQGERFCGVCGRDSSAGASIPQVDPQVAFGLPPETSGKAVFSLISGLIFLFFPFSISAVVFGYLALWDIRRNPGRLKGRGLAIAGIVLGYLGVAFTVGLIGLGIYSIRTEQKRSQNARNQVHTNEILKATSSESSAVSALRSLNTAEIAYAQAHHAAGYTCSLSDLKGAWGISSELAAGQKNGYVFKLQGCASANANGPIVKYQLVAYPMIAQRPTPAYCSDQSDVIRMARSGLAQDCLKSGVDLTQDEIAHPQAWSKSSR